MTTIVTAFLKDINKRKDMNTERYIENGKIIVRLDIPKVIFINEELIPELREHANPENTHFIPIKKEDIYLYEYIDLVNSELNIGNSSKDTVDYIFLMCNKTEYMRKAVELDYFRTGDTGQFMWIDFGINYIFKLSKEEFEEKVLNAFCSVYNSVRIAAIWNLNNEINIDIYRTVAWYFAGGTFGGDKKNLLIFADKTKQKCIQIIKEKNSIMWEVNIWYLIYKENKDLFYPYYCDHNESMLTNY